MNSDFDWIETQCQHVDEDVKHIVRVCRYFGHKTIQSYVDKLKTIRDKHKEKIEQMHPNYSRREERIEYYQGKMDALDKRIPTIQLMADTYPDETYKLWKKLIEYESR